MLADNIIVVFSCLMLCTILMCLFSAIRCPAIPSWDGMVDALSDVSDTGVVYREHSQANVSCIQGYTLLHTQGSPLTTTTLLITCDSTGRWQPFLPVCSGE